MSFRTVAALLLLAACSSGTQAGSRSNDGQLTGGASAQIATEQFLRAVHAKDLQAMGAVFGTSNGPARETMDRTELEKREIILQCYFDHDAYRVLGETNGNGGHRDVRVQLTKGKLVRQTVFNVIRGPGSRWYVDNMDIAAVREFCGNPGTTGR
ncbi:MAG TPA: hypothetical protein VM166_12240 [Gemmatimonadaceae bacterium]|nr:hypothetical protein [Gemmatimonadaceae bacterium]